MACMAYWPSHMSIIKLIQEAAHQAEDQRGRHRGRFLRALRKFWTRRSGLQYRKLHVKKNYIVCFINFLKEFEGGSLLGVV